MPKGATKANIDWPSVATDATRLDPLIDVSYYDVLFGVGVPFSSPPPLCYVHGLNFCIPNPTASAPWLPTYLSFVGTLNTPNTGVWASALVSDVLTFSRVGLIVPERCIWLILLLLQNKKGTLSGQTPLLWPDLPPANRAESVANGWHVWID